MPSRADAQSIFAELSTAQTPVAGPTTAPDQIVDAIGSSGMDYEIKAAEFILKLSAEGEIIGTTTGNSKQRPG